MSNTKQAPKVGFVSLGCPKSTRPIHSQYSQSGLCWRYPITVLVLKVVVLICRFTQGHVSRYLGGVRPINHQDTPEHAQALLDRISRIEHGILA